MVDVIEVPAPAVDQSGNLTVVWCTGTPATPLTSTAVKAGKRVTYSFIPGGWNPTTTQGIIKDPRLTLPQDLESLDKKVAGLTLQYVDSTDPNSAAVLLTEGTVGYFVERRNVPNKTDFAAAQVVRVISGTLGAQNPDAPADNSGKFTISQVLALNAVISTAILT